MTEVLLEISKAQAEEIVAAWHRAGNVVSLAAADLGIPRKTFGDRLHRSLAMLGKTKAMVAPAAIPPGQRPGKTTVQYDSQGNVIAEWRRLHPEADVLQAVADALCTQLEGKAPKLPKRQARGGDGLLLEVPLFDVHFGKYCWAPETGTDFDSSTAEALVTGAVERIAAQAGSFQRALLVIGGDFFHSDSRHNTTERGGHVLDVDTRQAKVWEVATRALHRSVELLAARAERIGIAVIPGNHDWESSFHLQRLLAAYYRNDPRVVVHESPRSRLYVKHGTVLLGLAHGHLIKMADLASLMAQEAPEWWAATTERVWHLGHLHKKIGMRWASSDTFHGVQVEHLESLAGTDAWHHEMGFVGSPRRLEGYLWHEVDGLVSRLYCPHRKAAS